MASPYQRDDLADEAALIGSRALAERLVADDQEPAGVVCGACDQPEGYYRDAIGAVMCASCGAVEFEGVWE